MKEYAFAFSTDLNYLNYTWACIYNLCKKKTIESFYKIYLIVTSDVTESMLPHYNDLVNCQIKIIRFDENLINGFAGIRHVSKATFVKIFIPSLIDEDYVLYMDGDIYINHSPETMWNDLPSNQYVAAVWDPGNNMEHNLLGLEEGEKTFNSGMMLMNCKKIKEDDMIEKFFSFYEEKKEDIQNADQTVFNAIFKHKWKDLKPQYNLQRAHFLFSARQLGLSHVEKRALIDNPIIIHFTTHSKPWMIRCANPFKKDYMSNYLFLYKNFDYRDDNVDARIKYIYEKMQYCIAYIK